MRQRWTVLGVIAVLLIVALVAEKGGTGDMEARRGTGD